jgi:hypothetical protein
MLTHAIHPRITLIVLVSHVRFNLIGGGQGQSFWPVQFFKRRWLLELGRLFEETLIAAVSISAVTTMFRSLPSLVYRGGLPTQANPKYIYVILLGAQLNKRSKAEVQMATWIFCMFLSLGYSMFFVGFDLIDPCNHELFNLYNLLTEGDPWKKDPLYEGYSWCHNQNLNIEASLNEDGSLNEDDSLNNDAFWN